MKINNITIAKMRNSWGRSFISEVFIGNEGVRILV